MSGTISISTSNTVAGLGNVLGVGYTTAILTHPSLTGVTVQPELGIVSNYTIIGSSDSDVTVDPTLAAGIGLNLLSTLLIETNGANVNMVEGGLASADLLSGTTIDIDGGSFQEAAGLITASLLNATDIGFSGSGTYVIESASSGSFIPIDLLNADNPITGFGSGDVIDDQNLNYNSITGYSVSGTDGGTETITVLTSDNSNLTFALANSSLATGSYASDTGPLHFSTDSTNGVAVTLCFLGGTRIATPDGEAEIETLRQGDLVLTTDGRAVPVRWIGINTVSTRFADSLRNIPVRISAGALGEGLPKRDLLVSPDHALMLDGILVQAGALVDGIAITRETGMPERFRYYHVEVAAHDLILAEGVAAETFVDNVSRMNFDNWEEFMAICGEEPPTGELPHPRVKAYRQLPAQLRARLETAAQTRLESVSFVLNRV